jgi:hypothetical protein
MLLTPLGPPTRLIPYDATAVVLSRDQKFLAFVSRHSGTKDVYVQPVGGDAKPERISTAGGTMAAWAPNGRELLYLREPEIMAVPFTVDGGHFRPGKERVWARVEGNYQDALEIGPDGRALVIVDRKGTPRELRVIVNWQQEIAKKLK